MRRQDFAIIGLLFLLPLILFWPQTIGGQTLIPTENLYQFEPYATYREVVRAPEIPHNALLSDLVLQNLPWKQFIRDQFAAGEIPLWNPYQFSGIPFMAAGQQSTLYPLSVLYYIMPLTAAYGWFTVINLWLAGVFMLALARGLGISHTGATLSAITYQLAGMFVASAVHPMIIGAVIWLPLLLLMIEFIIRQRPLFGRPATIPWLALGAVALGFNIYAGHPEITIYTLLIMGVFSAFRLASLFWEARRDGGLKRTVIRGLWLMALVILGLAVGAVQLIPLYEFVSTNWRAQRSSLETVLSYAHPIRDLIQFVLPNFYGSPAHHSYFDVFTGQTVAVDFINASGARVTNTEWGMKNYVEAALYLGILPLILSVWGVLTLWRERARRIYALTFGALAVLSLLLMFGAPIYALVYVLPGINQLNTPFRWVFGLTVAVAVLAGFGLDGLLRARRAGQRLGFVVGAVGLLTLIGLVLSRVFYPQIEPFINQIIASMAKASDVFNGAAMFYSYQFVNVLIFGVVTLMGGLAIVWMTRQRRGAPLLVVMVAAADLLIASWGFNPASDPLLLDFVPPALQWLQQQADESGGEVPQWRYAVLNGNGRDILRPNMTMPLGLMDVRGYDSIISKQYVDYMQQIVPQNLLDHNQISSLYGWDDYNRIILSPRFLRLNIHYIITHRDTVFDPSLTDSASPALEKAYEDEVLAIWRVNVAVPRAYTIADDDSALMDASKPISEDVLPVKITRDSGRELLLDVETEEPRWLIVSQTYAHGWKAYIRPIDAPDADERELSVERVYENFQGVRLDQAGSWTIRLIYSPTSFQIGVFSTLMGGAVILLLAGAWLWTQFVMPQRREGEDNATSRLARNSLVPILLNLFNRAIDFVFAFVMFRILGPQDAGFYYYAIVVFGWFDIFTNFGLDVYLMREAGRAREDAPRLFFNTSTLRLILVVAAVPLLIAFLLIRQASADPLNAPVLLTIGLFYLGLVPGSLSKGMTSLYYAFERAEYPAAVATVTTISRVILGVFALIIGYGIVGLGVVSIVTNLVTLIILYVGARQMLRGLRPQKPDTRLMRGMVGGSWALMLNHFLATIFFQIDIVILEWMKGARIVGLYRVAYSWLLAINVVPAFFTQALLPVMSRQAREDRAALRRTYMLGIKLLAIIAFPLAVGFTFVAEPLTWFLGGQAYLPDGAIALQIMIWSIPIGWMNSLTQYALVALDLQRRITVAFIGAVTFNIVTNLILIPTFSYQAAAITTIFSELVLFIPFALLMQSKLGVLPWHQMLWRPAAAAGITALVMFIGVSLIHPLFGVLAGVIVYLPILLALRPFDNEEWARLAPVLPGRVRRLLPAVVNE